MLSFRNFESNKSYVDNRPTVRERQVGGGGPHEERNMVNSTKRIQPRQNSYHETMRIYTVEHANTDHGKQCSTTRMTQTCSAMIYLATKSEIVLASSRVVYTSGSDIISSLAKKIT